MHAKATTGARGAFLGPRVDFKTFNAKACKGLCSRFSVQPSGLSPGAPLRYGHGQSNLMTNVWALAVSILQRFLTTSCQQTDIQHNRQANLKFLLKTGHH